MSEDRASSRIHYEELAVRIEAREGGGFLTRVVSTPVGSETRADFVSPYALEAVDGLLEDVGFEVRRAVEAGRGEDPGRRHLTPGSDRREAPSPQEVGTALFDALFAGPLRRTLDACRQWVETRGAGWGLRVRLHFDLDEPGLAAVAALPWELLYDRERGEFLGRRLQVPVVRSLESPGPPPREVAEPPLRLLTVLSKPPGASAALRLDDELTELERICRELPEVELERLAEPTVERLRQRLLAGDVQVVHFLGHGGFDAGNGGGHLFLEREDGAADPVPGPALAETLDVPGRPPLVVLNACESGRLTRRGGLDPFAGVASALVRRGLPAVVAMQFPISGAAALTFSRALYGCLGAGYPLDAAVAEGRLAIYQRDRVSLEWAVPSLTLRAVGGKVATPLILVRGLRGEEDASAVAAASRPPAAPTEDASASVETVRPPATPAAGGEGGGETIASGAASSAEPGAPGGGHGTEASRPAGGGGSGGRPWRRVLPLAAVALVLSLGWFLWRLPEGHPPGCPPLRGLGYEFVRIEPGSFAMGSDREEEAPIHQVTLSRPFCLGKTEVTRAQWHAVMEEGPLPDPDADDLPVAQVSWEDVQRFIERLNAGPRGGGALRLPTEAEWEYAARAGTNTAYSFGDQEEDLARYGNCLSIRAGSEDDRHDGTAPVGSFLPNPWGLYDMHGNVWEWVHDFYGPYSPAPVEDPVGPKDGTERVRRGGARDASAGNCRSASRKSLGPRSEFGTVGFRLVEEIPTPTAGR